MIKRLIVACLALVAAQVAVVQAQSQTESWQATLEKAIADSRGRSFVILDDDILAFGWTLRQISRDGQYVFTRCGGTRGMAYLSAKTDADRLKTARIVSPGHADYFATEAAYDKRCWSLEGMAGKKGSVI